MWYVPILMIGEKKAQTALHGLGIKQNGRDKQNLKGKTEYGLYMITVTNGLIYFECPIIFLNLI